MNAVGLGKKEDGKQATGQAPALVVAGAKHDTTVLATDAGAQKDKGLAAIGATTDKGKKPEVQPANKAAGEITSGGPRVININGVKFTDKIELHVLSAKEGLNELEAAMQEMFLRILNSGAVIQ
jgi:hypothetical protein